MTDDNERVAYLAGEEGVDVDDVTRADLDELMALLGDDTVWAEPGDHLEDAVVAAIAAERAVSPLAEAPAIEGPRARRARRSWNGPVAALSAAAAVAAVAVAGIVISRGGEDGTEVALGATPIWPDASGSARLSQTDSGWRIELDADGLPRLDEGRFYQAWLKNDEDVLVAIGTFNEPDDVVLWAGVPPAMFRTLTVTEEDIDDGDPGSSGRVVLIGNIVLD